MSQTLRISAGDYNITTASNANVIFSTGNVTINGNLTVANISYINQETITTSDVIQGNLTANAITVNLSLTTGTTLQAKGGIQNTPIGNVTVSTGAFSTLSATSTATFSGTTTNFTVSSMTSGTMTLGGTAQTGTQTFGQSASNNTVNFGSGTTSSNNTKLIYFGANGAAGSNTTITVGPTLGYGTVNFATNTNVTIANALTVGGNVILSNSLGVDGGTVTVFDSILDLHTYSNLAPWTFDDGRDIGVRFHYYKGGADTLAFLGLENSTNSLQFLVGATETSSNVTGTFGNVQFGTLLLSNTAISANTTSGALIVNGGAGIAGNINVGNVSTTGTVYGNAAPGATGMTSNAVGYLGRPQNSQSTGYTLALIDQGKHVYVTANSNVTIPANASVSFPIGSTIHIVNAGNVVSNVLITTDTLYLAGNGSTGTRTISSYGMATLVKVTNTSWYISGFGLT